MRSWKAMLAGALLVAGGVGAAQSVPRSAVFGNEPGSGRGPGQRAGVPDSGRGESGRRARPDQGRR